MHTVTSIIPLELHKVSLTNENRPNLATFVFTTSAALSLYTPDIPAQTAFP